MHFSQKKKPPAGLHQTEDRAGDAPKPPFPSKFIENQQKSNNQPPVNQKKNPLKKVTWLLKPQHDQLISTGRRIHRVADFNRLAHSSSCWFQHVASC